MGWKASCILISERGPGYLGSLPEHDPARARRLIADLGLGRLRSRGPTTFDEGIYPNGVAIGAYDGAAVLGDRGLPEFSEGADPLMQTILARYPSAEILRIGLHSVVNFWSYEFFEDGRLRRAHGGSADDGVVIDVGDLLPQERPHFDRSEILDGERVFFAEIDGELIECDTASYGEELVFSLVEWFFGLPFQGDRLWELEMEAFDRPRRWWPFG